jgi:hypothetical protein
MRTTIDRLLSWFGVILTVAMLAVGGLATWGSSFIANEVAVQFANQDITMPAQGAVDALHDQADKDALQPFVSPGNVMDTGAEARAYAVNYVSAHMRQGGIDLLEEARAAGVTTLANGSPLPDVMTYSNASQIGAAVQAAAIANGELAEGESCTAQAEPGPLCDLNIRIAENRIDSFLNGNTIVGLLLYGYAFATIGQIMGYAAIAAWVGAAIMLVLTILGFAHAGKVAKAAAPQKA